MRQTLNLPIETKPIGPLYQGGRSSYGPTFHLFVNLASNRMQKSCGPADGNGTPDKDYARAMVVAGPLIEPIESLEDVLHPVEDGWPVRHLGNLHQAFHSEER